MQSLQREVFQHFKGICPDIPDELAETTSDLAVHILESVKEKVMAIAMTAPEPKLTALLGLQLIRVWAEREVEAEHNRSAAR